MNTYIHFKELRSHPFFSVLGLSDEHEGLPFFTNLSDGIIAVSHEVKGHIENSAQAHNIQPPRSRLSKLLHEIFLRL